jgi:hypothetical protein
MTHTGDKFIDLLIKHPPKFKLPEGIEFINPYNSDEVVRVLRLFCSKFYNKPGKRILILGINPGRFGGGVTGISFTDPVALNDECGIANQFEKRTELSSRFIYEMINAFGGTELFYNNFILSAVCPYGFLKGEKNYNYYDSAELLKMSSDFIKNSLLMHAELNVRTDVVISLGKKNASMLEAFNQEIKVFRKVIYLDHPRFILQYRLKHKAEYINEYCHTLQQIIEST